LNKGQTVWIGLVLVLMVACLAGTDDDLPFSRLKFPESKVPPILQLEKDRTGKIRQARELDDVYVPATLDTLYLPDVSYGLALALEEHLRLLQRHKQKPRKQIGSLRFDLQDLEETIELMLNFRDYPAELAHRLEAHQVWGHDRKGHVRFTGYFTPVLPVRRLPDAEYRYPIYRRPKAWQGSLPTREEIDGQGVLHNQELELAYAADPVDIYYMQVQGSGFIEFIDDGNEQVLLSYDGNNKQPYRSIESYLSSRADLLVSDLSIGNIRNFLAERPALRDTVLWQNPSYVFFHPEGKRVIGAGHVPLSPGISVAVDHHYFPLGCVLLAMVPKPGAGSVAEGHEFRILLPQDVGGAVKGAGHLDLYEGIGAQAKRRAGNRSHYGMVWMLLPKKEL
jgi:membrane-bound lytic murein transglycosylase A